MTVPSGNFLVNTTGGAFSATTEGGTILGNTSTGTAITKALALKDNAAPFAKGTLPANSANGLIGNSGCLGGGGTFAYSVAGKYVIAASSDTLSGVANTKILITGRGKDLKAISAFQGSYGAKTVTAFRLNRFSWTHTKSHSPAAGTPSARHNWLDVATAGMSTASVPASLNEEMWSQTAAAAAADADHAVPPTLKRSLPGELVMKVDFVVTDKATGGDFFDYKAITGM
jgi:hypothetical protein